MSCPKRVLFLCTGNCSRSQMAEGLFRKFYGDRFESLSAGSQPAGFIHPLAIAALDQLGIDIRGQSSKSIREFLPPQGHPPDLLISVCDNAVQVCPTFPAAVECLHWSFEDPGNLDGTYEERLAAFCRIRDEIRVALDAYFQKSPADPR